MDLFSIMGIEIPEEKEEKKEPVKKKTSGQKSKGKTAAILHENVDINTGFCHWTPELEEAQTVSKLSDMFIQEYPGVCGLFEEGSASRLVVGLLKDVKNERPDTVLKAGTLVAFGPFQICMEEECTVKDALRTFAEQFEFEGCSAWLNPDGILCPYYEMSEKEPEVTFPARIGVADSVIIVTEVPDVADYKKELQHLYEKKYDAKLAGLHYNESTNTWMPVYKRFSGNKSVETVKSSKPEKKYTLPVQVRLPLTTITIEKEAFPEGVTEATAEEIRQKLELMYFEYSKERTVMEWNEAHSCLIAILKSSSKGSGEMVTPLGTFIMDDSRQLMAFQFALPKIPDALVEEIKQVARKNACREIAAQIFWEPDKNRYLLYFPRQEAGRTSVHFERNNNLEFTKVLVADFHSHGSLPAFFSAVDNRDELGWRLFSVLGFCDTEHPKLKLRVGANGSFIDLDSREYIGGNVEYYILDEGGFGYGSN